jgi:hypothetical protein
MGRTPVNVQPGWACTAFDMGSLFAFARDGVGAAVPIKPLFNLKIFLVQRGRPKFKLSRRCALL